MDTFFLFSAVLYCLMFRQSLGRVKSLRFGGPPRPVPPPHLTPCPGVTAPYLPPPRCPQGRCRGRGSAAPRCGQHGSPSPSRARTPSRPRWHSQHFSPASRGEQSCWCWSCWCQQAPSPPTAKTGKLKPRPWLWNPLTPRMGQVPRLLQPLQNDSCWFKPHQILDIAWTFGVDHLILGLGSSISQPTVFFPMQQPHLKLQINKWPDN